MELKSEHEKLILSKEKKISEAEKRIKDKESQVSNELAQTKKLNEELEQKNQECAHRISLVDKKTGRGRQAAQESGETVGGNIWTNCRRS